MQVKTSKPAKRAGKRVGRYLYAVIDAPDKQELGLSGINGGQVYPLADGRVAAVVSDLPCEKLRPERRHLAAHHDVLKQLIGAHTVLPMSFGLVAEGPEAVHKFLRANRDTFLESLRGLAGKVEMGLRVVYDIPNIIEHFVNTRPKLRLFRDRVFRSDREPSQEDKIALGRLFDQTLTDDRALQTERVAGILGPHCFKVKETKVRNEREVMNLACLIGRDKPKEFEEGVFEAAQLFDNHYAFDFNGPWPPQNFVETSVQW